MLFIEEYFKRHDVVGVTLIPHSNSGSAFLIDKKSKMPILFCFNKREDGHGPHKYVFKRLVAQRNEGKGIFETISNDTVEWDEYEEYIKEFAKRSEQYEAITDVMNIILTAWKMFVISCDASLRTHATDFNFFRSIDSRLSPVDRHTSYTNFLFDFSHSNPSMCEVWSREFLTHVKSSSLWLQNILNEKHASADRI